MPYIQLWAFCIVKHICFNNLYCLKEAINSYREKENTQKSSNARRKQHTRQKQRWATQEEYGVIANSSELKLGKSKLTWS